MNAVRASGESRGWRGCRLLLVLLALGPAAAADDMQARAEEARARMAPILERLLGSPFVKVVPVVVLDKDAFAKKYEEARPAHPRAEAIKRLWVRLGFFRDPSATEPTEPPYGPLGFYVREEKNIYVLADDSAPTNSLLMFAGHEIPYTVTHELVHAHRHAAGLYEKRPTKWSDAASAFQCLAEGDAVFWESAVRMEDRGARQGVTEAAERIARENARNVGLPSPSQEWYAVIAVLRETYAQGARFAAEVHAHGGREALDAALLDPPTTTEQILHPEKYLGPDKDEPIRFGEAEVGSVLGTEWTYALAGDLGELVLGVFFARALEQKRGRRIAEGWDGCRFQLYTRDGRVPLLVLMTAWDTEQDAAVFAGAWCDWAGRRDGESYDVHTKLGPAGAMRSVRTQAGLVVTARRGNEVMVVDGVEPEKSVAILRALWRAPRKP